MKFCALKFQTLLKDATYCDKPALIKKQVVF